MLTFDMYVVEPSNIVIFYVRLIRFRGNFEAKIDAVAKICQLFDEDENVGK